MAFCGEYESLHLEAVIDWCRSDRDLLIEKMMRRYPQFRGLPPSAWIADLIPALCGFRVADHPLPRGQLGLCDMANRLVLVNSQMKSFVHRSVDLAALHACVLGHELGHIQMHQGELERQFVSSYGRWEAVEDGRTMQREQEAELYASVFMVPRELLRLQPMTRVILQACRGEGKLSSLQLKDGIAELAKAFGVTRALMTRSLEARGWVEPGGKRVILARR
jgi:hypothetical protein